MNDRTRVDSRRPGNQPEYRIRPLAASLVLAMSAAPFSAMGGTINVVDGLVDAVADGQCSLVEAIENANSPVTQPSPHLDCPGADMDPALLDTIVLPAGSLFTLATNIYSPNGDNGLPMISSRITIAGNGSTLNRTATAPIFRIAQVLSSGELNLNSVTLSGGDQTQPGGGIFNEGSLTLNSSVVSGNNSGSVGGGIYNEPYNGDLTLNNSTVSGNQAAASGGGIFIGNYSSAGISNSTISGNQSGSNGGGVFLGYVGLTVVNSTISGNTATGNGGGFLVAQGPSIGGGDLTLVNSTLSGNTANFGGALFANSYTNVDMTNATVSGNNTVILNSGDLHINGTPEPTVTMTNTIVANSTSGSGCFAGVPIPIVRASGRSADDSAEEAFCIDDGAGTGCSKKPPSLSITDRVFTNAGNSWFEDASCDGTASGDPQLAALSDNGGPTQTHALLPTSPLIDTGDDVICSNAPVLNLDQRGFPRPIDGDGNGVGNCDIGAFEFLATDVAVTAVDVPDPVTAGSGPDNLLYTFTVTNNSPLPADAQDLVLNLSSVLPAGVAAGTVTPSAGTWAAPDWTLTSLPGGASETIDVAFTVDGTALAGADVVSADLAVTAISPLWTLLNTTDDSFTELTSIVRAQFALTVTRSGSGSGTVTSAPAGIDCGITCSAPFDDGTVVDLLPAADIGSSFIGWTGDPDCTDGQVTVTATMTCDAQFDVNDVDVSVSVLESIDPVTAGSGSNNLVYTFDVYNRGPADASGLSLQLNSILPGGVIAATVVPSSGTYSTPNWNIPSLPADTGATLTVPYTVSINTAAGTNVISASLGVTGIAPPLNLINPADDSIAEDTSVIAAKHNLNVSLTGSGSGSVSSTPAGINCGVSCSALFDHNTVVLLDPLVQTGSTFAGWSGDGDCLDGQLTMSADRNCIARFDLVPHVDLALTVTESADPAIAGGDDLNHRYTLHNNSSLPASDILVTGFGEPGFSRQLSTSLGVVTDQEWTITTLAPGNSAHLDISFTLAADTPAMTDAITTQASVAAVTPSDDNPANDQAVESTSIATEAALALSLTDDTDPVNQFDLLQLVATVDNPGPSDAGSILVTSTLPAGFEFLETTGCAEDPAGVPGCALGTIPAGEGRQFRIKVKALEPGNQVSQISLTSDTTNTGQMDASETTRVEELQLVLLPSELPPGQVGVDYLTFLSLANGTPPDTFSIPGEQLPPGITLNGASLNGIPTQAGIFPMTVSAIDSKGAAGTQIYQFEILPPGLIILTDSLLDGLLDFSYRDRLRSSGGTPPLNWTVASGVPAGLSVDAATGNVFGTPEQAGDFVLDVKLDDADGSSATRAVPLRIEDGSLINLTPALPDGIVGVDYQGPFVISGGVPPLHCMLFDGLLPPGTAISASEAGCQTGVTGVPESTGTFGFSVKASDNMGRELVFSNSIRVMQAGTVQPRFPDEGPVEIPTADLSPSGPGDDFPDESYQKAAVDAFGNTFLVGFSWNGADYDLALLKYSAPGEILWQESFDSGNHDYGYGVAVDPLSQAVYVSGLFLDGVIYKALLIKYDVNGQLEWQREFSSGSSVDAFYDVQADGRRICVAGESYNGANFDGLVSCYNPQGTRLWKNTRRTGSDETGYRIAFLPCPAPHQGNCLVAGGAEGANLDRGWLLTLRSGTGVKLKDQAIDDMPVEGMSLAADSLVVGGTNHSTNWRVRGLDSQGNTLWNREFPAGDQLRAVSQDSSGFIYATGRGTGQNNQDGLILLLDADGNQLDELRIERDGPVGLFEGLVRPDNNLVVAGQQVENGDTKPLLMFIDMGTGL